MKKVVASLLFLMAIFGVARADDPVPEEGDVCKQAIDLLSAGKQADAEKLIFTRAKEHPTKRIVFFEAVLVRSRFDREVADRIFAAVNKYDPACTEGKAAAFIIAMDRDQATQENFNSLDDLSAKNPDDVLLLWMVAVECRQLDKPKIGVERYTKLLETFNPGPVLVHQTFGNLLLEDHQPDKALEQYDIAIKLEPESWDYNCRGNALMALHRLDDAAAAYEKATELNPNDVLPWENWAILCDAQHDPAGAAEKRAKVAEIRSRQK